MNREIVRLADGVTMSIQASAGHYCHPRVDNFPLYLEVEVGYITNKDGEPLQPSKSWNKYRDSEKIFAYVPTELVIKFIRQHGGFKEVGSEQDL